MTVVHYEKRKTGGSTDVVEITWSGDVLEGFNHTAPFDIPKDCILMLNLDVGLLGERETPLLRDDGEYVFDAPKGDRFTGITIPSINNAIAVIGNVIPIELHRHSALFLPKMEYFEDNGRLETTGFFRRDIDATSYKEVNELIVGYWKPNNADFMVPNIQRR